MTFTERADALHCQGKLASVHHASNAGRKPIVTRYTVKNRFSKGFRHIVARSNDWWQVRLDNGTANTVLSKRADQ